MRRRRAEHRMSQMNWWALLLTVMFVFTQFFGLFGNQSEISAQTEHTGTTPKQFHHSER